MFWPTDKEYIVGTASPAELVRSISTDVVEISFIVQATFVEKDVHLPERFMLKNSPGFFSVIDLDFVVSTPTHLHSIAPNKFSSSLGF